MASIYLEDGSVKHIHELNSLLDKDGPLKQMGCECPGTPKANGVDAILKMCDASLNKAATPPTPRSLKNAAGCSESHAKQNVDSNSRHTFPSPNVQRFSNVSSIATPKTDSSGLIPLSRQSISNVSVPKSTNKEDNFNGSCKMPEAAGSANESKVVSSIPNKNSGGSDDLFCDGLEMGEFNFFKNYMIIHCLLVLPFWFSYFILKPQ